MGVAEYTLFIYYKLLVLFGCFYKKVRDWKLQYKRSELILKKKKTLEFK